MTSTLDAPENPRRVNVALVSPGRIDTANTYEQPPARLTIVLTGIWPLLELAVTPLDTVWVLRTGAREAICALSAAIPSRISASSRSPVSENGEKVWEKYPIPRAPWIKAIHASAFTSAGVRA